MRGSISKFHVVASTEKLWEGRGRIYGTKGEIKYDSKVIRVHDFASKHTQTYHPRHSAGAHGGGDVGLVQQFVKACDAVRTQAMSVAEAQRVHVGCTLEEVLRSYAMVFAAEEARKGKKIVEWSEWWTANVGQALEKMSSSKSDSGVPFLNGGRST